MSVLTVALVHLVILISSQLGCGVTATSLVARSEHISLSQQAVQASIVVLGARIRSEPLAPTASAPSCLNPGQKGPNVELRLYRDSIDVQQVIKGAARPGKLVIHVFRADEALLPPDMKAQLQRKQLWFLREESGKLRPLTDLCLNSVDLHGFPDNRDLVRSDNSQSTAEQIAEGLLNPANAKDWPSFQERLPDLQIIAETLRNRP